MMSNRDLTTRMEAEMLCAWLVAERHFSADADLGAVETLAR